MAIEISNKIKKPLRRKLFEDENVKLTNGIPTPSESKNPVELCDRNSSSPSTKHTPRRSTPLSERQQIALLLQLTAESQQAGDSCLPSEDQEKFITRRQGGRYVLYKRNERGETPLHVATIKGDIEEVQRLLDQGVSVNVPDFAGWTALHEACNYGWYGVAELLIKAGAEVNVAGLGKDTPLHDAAINGHCEIVQLLLRYGADPNQRNAQWKTPLDVARSEGVAKVLKDFFQSTGSSQVEVSSGEASTTFWQSATPPCQPTNHWCDLTMRKNSPQNQTHKGADKPTSPRLTLRFQSIRTRDDKNSTNTKINDLSSNPAKYPTYCVTMEAKGDVYELDDCHVSSTQSSLPESDVCSTKPNVMSKEDSAIVDSSKDVTLQLADEVDPSQAIKMETEEVTSAKINGSRLSSDSCSKEASDTEKEEGRRKRRKSNDSIQSRHSSIGHSSVKSHKSPSGKSSHSDGHNDHRNSPKGKKRGSLSVSDTESNPSDSDMPDIMVPDSLSSSSHNGTFGAALHSPKVPPLKIVIPSGSNSLELETRERSKVSSSKSALPYVVNSAESMDIGSSDSNMNSFISDGTKDGVRSIESTPSKSKDDSHPPEERFQRVTRSSQRIQAAMSSTTTGGTVSSSIVSDTNYVAAISSSGQKMEHSSESSNEDLSLLQMDVHPRKRKLRSRDSTLDCISSNSIPSAPLSSYNSPPASEELQQNQQNQLHQHPHFHHQHPQQQQQQQQLNSYQMYLNIRKQVNKRRRSMFIVHPKPPNRFKDYLLNKCSYVLEGNSASKKAVTMLPPPQTLEGAIKELFVQQEKDRYGLRLQHLIEREKLTLSAEQEILRVHGRAARAMANQTVPLSVCSILKDEEIYNVLDIDQEEKEKINVRSRYNGRLFLSWLQDVDDKWEKIRDSMLLRHHNEAESLHAVQKLDWEWKMKELAMCDFKTTPIIDDISVPMVTVVDEFERLPITV